MSFPEKIDNDGFETSRRIITGRRSDGFGNKREVIPAPDITDQYTLTRLARMAANACALPGGIWTQIIPFVILLYRFNPTPEQHPW